MTKRELINWLESCDLDDSCPVVVESPLSIDVDRHVRDIHPSVAKVFRNTRWGGMTTSTWAPAKDLVELKAVKL